MSVNLFVKLLGLHLLYELQFCKKLKMKADSHNSIFFYFRLIARLDGLLGDFKVLEGLMMERNGMLRTFLKNWMYLVNGFWIKQA